MSDRVDEGVGLDPGVRADRIARLRLLRTPGDHAAEIREEVLKGLRTVATSVN